MDAFHGFDPSAGGGGGACAFHACGSALHGEVPAAGVAAFHGFDAPSVEGGGGGAASEFHGV